MFRVANTWRGLFRRPGEGSGRRPCTTERGGVCAAGFSTSRRPTPSPSVHPIDHAPGPALSRGKRMVRHSASQRIARDQFGCWATWYTHILHSVKSAHSPSGLMRSRCPRGKALAWSDEDVSRPTIATECPMQYTPAIHAALGFSDARAPHQSTLQRLFRKLDPRP
jgi:hypothetical protein